MTYTITRVAFFNQRTYFIYNTCGKLVYSDTCHKTAKAVYADLNRLTKETK